MIKTDMRPIIFIVIMAILIVGSMYATSGVQENTYASTVNEPSYADGFMEEVIATRMKPNGTPDSTLYSPKLVHFSQNNSTRMTSPHFVITPQRGEPWYVYANHGTSSDGAKTLYLWGDVKLHQMKGPFNKESTVLTTSLTVYPKKNTAYTNQPVTLIQHNTLIKGKGLKADFKTSTIELLSQSSGVYDPTE